MAETERVTATPKKTITLTDGKEYQVSKMTLKDAKVIIPALKKLDELRKTNEITEELLLQMQEVSFLILSRDNSAVVKEQLDALLEVDTVYKLIALASGV